MDPVRPLSASSKPRAAVLLVDDEEILRRLLGRTLAGAGFTVVEAQNGEVALEAARTLNGQLSLVITDISMPVMDGLEFARAFRPLYPGVPILFMTGKDPMLSLAPGSGVEDNLLRKPFGPDVFLEAVARALGRGVRLGRTSA
jgi:two-component system, chemotaxis family, chemotaxis protein CheY